LNIPCPLDLAISCASKSAVVSGCCSRGIATTFLVFAVDTRKTIINCTSKRTKGCTQRIASFSTYVISSHTTSNPQEATTKTTKADGCATLKQTTNTTTCGVGLGSIAGT
jgi:hypothetical protein